MLGSKLRESVQGAIVHAMLGNEQKLIKQQGSASTVRKSIEILPVDWSFKGCILKSQAVFVETIVSIELQDAYISNL